MTDRSVPTITASHPHRGTDDVDPLFSELAGWVPDGERGRALRDDLIERYLPLAEHIAARFAIGSASFDDLLPYARAGLARAVDRFAPGDGSSFLAFAVPTIIGEVRRHSRDYAGSAWIPPWLAQIRQPIEPAVDTLRQRLGRMPTAGEIADEVGGDRVEVTRALVVHAARRA